MFILVTSLTWFSYSKCINKLNIILRLLYVKSNVNMHVSAVALIFKICHACYLRDQLCTLVKINVIVSNYAVRRYHGGSRKVLNLLFEFLEYVFRRNWKPLCQISILRWRKLADSKENTTIIMIQTLSKY